MISMIFRGDKCFLGASALRLASSLFSMECIKPSIASDLYVLARLNLSLATFIVRNVLCC